MKRLIINHAWWITALLALGFLIAHTLSIGFIKVDHITIILLLILLISPFISAIKKNKYGDFEAEIDSKEVQKIKDELSKTSSKSAPSENTPEIQDPINSIKQLVTSDPVVALAKLRIELEKVLSKLYRLTHNKIKEERPIAIGKIIFDLTNKEILSQDISGPMRDVISICNRAIHGGEIRTKDAESIIDIGTSLLEKLYWQLKDFVLKPQETITISGELVEEYTNAKYRLTTIIPYVKNPVKNIRIVGQEELDDFLEGYNEFAEFIIEIVRIENNQDGNTHHVY